MSKSRINWNLSNSSWQNKQNFSYKLIFVVVERSKSQLPFKIPPKFFYFNSTYHRAKMLFLKRVIFILILFTFLSNSSRNKARGRSRSQRQRPRKPEKNCYQKLGMFTHHQFMIYYSTQTHTRTQFTDIRSGNRCNGATN